MKHAYNNLNTQLNNNKGVGSNTKDLILKSY